jgi:predicted DNA binding protein
MRAHKVTIRELATRLGITQATVKRLRAAPTTGPSWRR